jgi:GMP synthase PP-ATPase subunit
VKDASARYFEALKDIYDPEAKRKIIGDLFFESAGGCCERFEIES